MMPGKPLDKDACQNKTAWGNCGCGPKCWCGYGPHWAIHGGVLGKPGFVFGHEYQPPNAAERGVTEK